MNLKRIKQLESELRIMDLNDLKPNYAALARKYHMDYRTVKKYHEGYEGKPKKRNKPSKLDDHLDEITEKLNINRVTLKAVHEWLVDTYSLDKIGSYSNFKVYCRKNNLKPIGRNGVGSGMTRYETEPGDMAQADWKENIIMTSRYGEVFTINIFHLVMKFSRYSYLELTLSKEQRIVQRCLINAFNFYGGIPKRVLFDNMSTVADTTVKPKRINTRMIQFGKDFNFTIQLCKTRHAFTKGTNEARNKILDWIRPYNNEFETFEDLQIIVEKINIKMNLDKCQGTDVPPCILFYKEKEYLSPMPNSIIVDGYLAPSNVKVSPQQLVSYQGIKYSVDKKYIDEYVSFEEFNDILQIYYKGKIIQIHHLSKNPINYTKEHYKQSLGGTIKQENMDEVISNNLSIMDKLLETRETVITKEDAAQSNEGMLAYLASKGRDASWVIRFIKTLSSEEKNIFLSEVSKLMPYVYDETQLLCAFKHAASKKDIKYIRAALWELNFTERYCFLTKEGLDSINNEFEDEIRKRLQNLGERNEIK